MKYLLLIGMFLAFTASATDRHTEINENFDKIYQEPGVGLFVITTNEGATTAITVGISKYPAEICKELGPLVDTVIVINKNLVPFPAHDCGTTK